MIMYKRSKSFRMIEEPGTYYFVVLNNVNIHTDTYINNVT